VEHNRMLGNACKLKILSIPCLLLSVVFPCRALTQDATMEQGFDLLYDLKFDEAQHEFARYEQLHPDDPLGPVSEAAGILFEQLDRIGLYDKLN